VDDEELLDSEEEDITEEPELSNTYEDDYEDIEYQHGGEEMQGSDDENHRENECETSSDNQLASTAAEPDDLVNGDRALSPISNRESQNPSAIAVPDSTVNGAETAQSAEIPGE
jgi:hypothetical protein